MKRSIAIGCRLGWALAPMAFLLDRITKRWAVSALKDGEVIDAWPGVFRFVYIENRGAAFGLMQGMQIPLVVVTIVLLLAGGCALIWKRKSIPVVPKALLWLLWGGALGNLVDRILYGYVIDFIEFYLISFPVFNIADACVVVASFCLAAWILFSGEQKPDGK